MNTGPSKEIDEESKRAIEKQFVADMVMQDLETGGAGKFNYRDIFRKQNKGPLRFNLGFIYTVLIFFLGVFAGMGL